ncbi:MAG: hypothetical protein COC24_006225 [Alphaproteobacteria bacterium]|nr:hypothetical protein [Alphaproteobacteria bacterium]
MNHTALGRGVNQVNGGSGIDLLSVSDADFAYVIQKPDDKISFNHANGVHVLNSIETIRLMDEYGSNIVASYDVKDIWSDLAADEQSKFSDEADFLSWLGDDAGYNYEGL